MPIEWETVDVTPVKGPDGKMGIPQAAIDSVNKHKIGLKGPLMTPVGKGHRSLNLAIRKEFELYANVRPCRSLEGKGSRLMCSLHVREALPASAFFVLMREKLFFRHVMVNRSN